MDTRAPSGCQTLRRTLILALAWPCFALGADLASTAPSPAPPPWQQELAAARLLEARLLLAPASDGAEADRQCAALAETFRRLAAKYPDAAPVQQATGDHAAALGQEEEAMRDWQRAETLDPQNPAAAEALSEGSLRLGQTREAYRHFTLAVQARPDAALAHFNLGNVLYLFRHDLAGLPGVPDEAAALDQALEHLRRASELAPTDVRMATGYAETFYILARPDWEQALAAWQKVLALSGGQTSLPNSHLARISLRLGRPEDARRYLDAIRDPAFDAMQTKFRQQAARMEPPPANH